jgi:hypothetical protein
MGDSGKTQGTKRQQSGSTFRARRHRDGPQARASITLSLSAEFGACPIPGMLWGPQTPPRSVCHLRTPCFPQPANSQHRGLLGLPLSCGTGCAGSEEKHGPVHLDPQPIYGAEQGRERERERETEIVRNRQKTKTTQRGSRASKKFTHTHTKHREREREREQKEIEELKIIGKVRDKESESDGEMVKEI